MTADLSDLDIGHYRLESVLGRGRGSTVYVATSARDRQRYAFKILDTAEDRDSRLLRQLVMALENPHVVKIYDYGTHDGHPWLVRELVVGRALDEVLREAGVLNRADTVDVGLQVAAGLQGYQANGMAHGALHPGNILLSDDLVVRLCDPSVRTAGAEAAWWVAPEIAAGGAFDQASDQFSLGTVMHRALTGRIRAGSAPWAGCQAGPELIAVLERMLSADPAARFPSLDACLAALRQAAVPASATSAAPPTPAVVTPEPVPPQAKTSGGKTSRLVSRSQQQRIDGATKRIAEALAEAELFFAAGDLDNAAGHADRANAIVVTLAMGLPASVTEGIVAMRSKIAAARKARSSRRGWRRLFG